MTRTEDTVLSVSPRSLCRKVLVVLITVSCILQWTLLDSSAPSDHAMLDDFFYQSRVNYSALPHALHPVVFHKCCDGKAESFFSTCFTEMACHNDTSYPFVSPNQAKLFEFWGPRSRQELDQHNASCRHANQQLIPPTKWCQTFPSHDDLAKFHEDLIFPMGCSWYSMEHGSGPYDRMIVFPQGQLVLCGIPKAGMTQWLQFLRFSLGAKDYQSYPHQKPEVDFFMLDKRTRAFQKNVWTNPNWTKAVLIRHPAERLLSAYLDKVERKAKRQGTNTTFRDFVHSISTSLDWYTDPHWRPQAWSCGLSEYLPQFSHVGTLDNAAFPTKQLLQHAHLWNEFGQHYRVSTIHKRTSLSNAAIYPPEISTNTNGFQQEHTKMDAYQHNQHSKEKMKQYYTPALLKKVKRLYWMDMELYKAIRTIQDPNGGLVHGRDVARLLNPNCTTR